MANVFQKKEYEQVKNERYTLIMFDEHGKRIFTYSGLSLIRVMHEQMQCMTPHRVTLIVHDSYMANRPHDRTATNWDIESFADLFALKGAALYPKETD